KALKFYSSVRLDIRRIESLKNGNDVIGNRVRVKTVKNKVAPPFREAIFDILFGEGISREGTVLDMAVELNIVEKAGSWFAYEGNRIGQGRDQVRAFLKDNQALCDVIDKKVRAEMIRLNKIKADEAVAKSLANASRYSEFPTPSQLAGGKALVGEGVPASKPAASAAPAPAGTKSEAKSEAKAEPKSAVVTDKK
ncbi:MAG TPA: hypothetical protein VK786_03375, partial [bacterium]|nr:hypothetical protein [bacterium]